jgi:hypothetical protein
MSSVLVGKYLVSSVETGSPGTSGIEWRTVWYLHRSRSGDGRDWESFERGAVAGPFTNSPAAASAGVKAGIQRAREIQGDESLQAIEWHSPFPKVAPDSEGAAP